MIMIKNYVKWFLIFAWIQCVPAMQVKSKEVTQFVQLSDIPNGPKSVTIPFKLAPVLNLVLEYSPNYDSRFVDVILKKNPNSPLPLGILHHAPYRVQALIEYNDVLQKHEFNATVEPIHGDLIPVATRVDYRAWVSSMDLYIHMSSDLIDQWRQEIIEFNGIGQLDENEIQELDFCREQTLVFYADEDDAFAIEMAPVNLVQLAQVSEYFRARLRATTHSDGENRLDCQSPLKLVHPSFNEETVQDLLQYLQGRYFPRSYFSGKSEDYLERMQAICDFLMIESLNRLISQLLQSVRDARAEEARRREPRNVYNYDDYKIMRGYNRQ